MTAGLARPNTANRLGFVAADASLCGELDAAAAHCAHNGRTLVVSSRYAEAEAARTAAAHQVAITLDTHYWRSRWATADQPTHLHGDPLADAKPMFPMPPGGWREKVIQKSQANAVYVPTYTVPAGKPDVLRSALDHCAESAQAGLLPFLPLEARSLSARNIDATLTALDGHPGLHLTFQFTGKGDGPLASYDLLRGLRQLLDAHAGSDIIGIDITGGLDALAHGAGWVGIGASAGLRFPRNPGVTGGQTPAAGWKPGTWLREIMETRSPDIYADWYVNRPSPWCSTCHRSLDLFEATPDDKSNIITHNLHGTAEFAAEMLAHPIGQRAGWLAQVRVAAFEAHARLLSPARKVSADLILRQLVELDDPQARETRADGRWVDA